MAAVFEHSWALLTDFERDSLASLTVFRGGFTREAAEAVTGTSLRTLLMLENKSLLRRDDRGRFDMLAVVRQLALAKLEEYEPVRSRHSAFFAHFLRVREAALIGEGLVRALEDVAAEIDNVRQAWDWALMQAHADGLDDMAETLCRFFENRGLMHEGEHAFKGAVEAMTGRESASPRLLVKLRSRYGFFCHRLNRFEEAESLLRQSLRELEHTQDPHEQVFALNVLGSILFARDRFPESQRAHQKGLELAQCHNDDAGIVTALAGLGAAAYARADYVEARDYFKQVLESARARKDVYSIARGLKNVGMILGVLGEYVQAEQILKEAVALCRQLGDQRALASSLNNLGRLKLITGELDQSVAFLKECADIHAQIGNRVGVALAHSNIGEAYHEAGDLGGARSHLAASLEQFRQIENRSGMALTLSRMGFVLLDQGAPERAQQHFVEALGQAADAHERAQVLNGVTGLALVLSEQGQVARAVELLTVVERLPGHERHATDQISAWLADFRSRLSAEDFTTARVKGKSRQLDTVVRELLEQQQPKE